MLRARRHCHDQIPRATAPQGVPAGLVCVHAHHPGTGIVADAKAGGPECQIILGYGVRPVLPQNTKTKPNVPKDQGPSCFA